MSKSKGNKKNPKNLLSELQSALTIRNHLPSTTRSQALDWRPENVSQMMAGIQEVGWVNICQISLLQGSFTGILQLCLFPCFWKTPEIRQFTFMHHSKALCKYVKNYCFGNYYSTTQNYHLKNLILKKTRHLNICSVLPKDRYCLFRRSHQIRGRYRQIRKKVKAMPSI